MTWHQISYRQPRGATLSDSLSVQVMTSLAAAPLDVRTRVVAGASVHCETFRIPPLVSKKTIRLPYKGGWRRRAGFMSALTDLAKREFQATFLLPNFRVHLHIKVIPVVSLHALASPAPLRTRYTKRLTIRR